MSRRGMGAVIGAAVAGWLAFLWVASAGWTLLSISLGLVAGIVITCVLMVLFAMVFGGER